MKIINYKFPNDNFKIQNKKIKGSSCAPLIYIFGQFSTWFTLIISVTNAALKHIVQINDVNTYQNDPS
jgi:hypothetical protein